MTPNLNTLTKTKINTGVALTILVLVAATSTMMAGFYLKYQASLSVDLTKGLVSYWSFDQNNANDEVGNNNGQLKNQAQIVDLKTIKGENKNDPKKRAGVLSLDNSKKGYVVTMPKDSLAFSPENSFAISAWIKTDEINQRYQTIVAKTSRTAIGEREYLVDLVQNKDKKGKLLNSAKVRFCINDQNGKRIEQCTVSKISIKPGQWYNIYANYDVVKKKGKIVKKVLKTYVNGRYQKTTKVSNYNPKNNNGNLFIGSLYDTTATFGGLIDDVMIYNRSLQGAEIKAIYNRKIPATGKKIVKAEPQLVAWWKFDETTGNKASDSTGTNTCTLYGNPQRTNFSVSGKAILFDGVDDYLDCGIGDNLKTPEFTTMAWVYHGENTKLGDAIFGNSKWGGSIDYGYFLRFWGQSSVLQAGFGRAGTGELGIWTSGIPQEEFIHLAISYDGTTAKVYKNGVMIGESGLADYQIPIKHFLIGYDHINGLDYNQGDVFFNGIIDEVMVFNRAINASEIKDIYQEVTFCGNGDLNKDEECDWGIVNGGDECSTNCLITNECKDGKDNDGDGLADLEDPGCFTSKKENTATTECQDGINNDNDKEGLIDMDDPECTARNGNSEKVNVLDITRDEGYLHSMCLDDGTLQKGYLHSAIVHFDYFRCSGGCDASGGKGTCVDLASGCDGN